MMKGTDYTVYGQNEGSRRTIRQSDSYSSSKESSIPIKDKSKKQPVVYFLTEKEEQLGKLARSGTREVSTPGIYLYIGFINKARGSRDYKAEPTNENMLTGHVIEVNKILESYLDIQLQAGLVLKKYEENDSMFDKYLGLPFVKGMTDLRTKRTMLIVGDYTHHGQAAQGYFMVGEKPYNFNDDIGFGSVVLWNNIGDLESNGFLGMDYQHRGKRNLGCAKSLDDVVKVLSTLKEQGFSGNKEVILLRTPHIRESQLGNYLRKQIGAVTLEDYLKLDTNVLESKDLSEYLLSLEAERDEIERLQFMGGGKK